MIEASAALSTLAAAIAAPPPAAEANLRAPAADQPQKSAERAGGANPIRYFRFNLKYDAVDQQLYFVFKNPVTGAVIDEAPSERSVRSPIANRQSALVDTASAPTGSQSAAASDGSSAPSSGGRVGAPPVQGAPAAPGASSGASSGGEVGRGSAVDSRI